MTRLALCLCITLALPVAAQDSPECTDPAVHGILTGLDEDALVVSMTGRDTVLPGTRGVVCQPWRGPTGDVYRLARVVEVVSSTTDRARVKSVYDSGVSLVPNGRVRFEALARPGLLTLDVDDGRASVLQAGERIGGTPLVLPLPSGDYTFELARPGHASETVAVTVVPGRPVAEQVALQPTPEAFASRSAGRKAALTVTSEPAGAVVFIDGAEVGVTPYTSRPLAAGSHEVEVVQAGFSAPPQTVAVGDGPQEVAFAMGPPPGFVLAGSPVPGVEVQAEGGAPRPAPALLAMEAGARRVLVRGGGVRESTEQVDVESGLVTLIAVGHEVALGWIDVSAPDGASVALNGVEIARGPTRLRVAPGEYPVSVGVNGQTLVQETVRVDADQTATLSAGGGDVVASAAGGGRAVIDLPDAPAASVVPSAPAAVAGPAPPAARPAAPPAASREDAAACASQTPEQVWATVDALVDEGRYTDARSCLVVLGAQQPQNRRIYNLKIELDMAQNVLNAMPEAQATLVRGLRTKMRGDAERGDREALRATAGVVLSMAENDPATLAILRRGLSGLHDVPAGQPVEMVYVPGATERLPNDPSLMSVTSPPQIGFLLSAREITNAEVAAFLNDIDRRQAQDFVGRRPRDFDVSRRGEYSVEPGREQWPATTLSREGAEAFARWAGGRLPAATEWTWAFQLGRRGSVSLAGHLSTEDAREPVDVGSYPPDALGLYDMLGNVWEWLNANPRTPFIAGGSFISDGAQILSDPVTSVNNNAPAGQTGLRLLVPLPD